ncbi:MAG: DUF1800 domain-containing protein [Gemmatimonadaceae bacterium]|nr:DUF1800 domain-containing protein [Gemmatimonadaceae bacterium]
MTEPEREPIRNDEPGDEHGARVVAPPLDIERPASRRAFFIKGAAIGAGAVGSAALAQRIGRSANVGGSSATPRIPGLFHNAPTDVAERWGTLPVRLSRRIAYGLTQNDVQQAKMLGFAGYLDYQLDYASIDDGAVDSFVAFNYPELAMTGAQLVALTASTVQSRLQEATLFRAAFSKRQLYERMVEFWSDHFNISMNKVGYLKVIDDRSVIRANALGKFPAMLRASAHSAAMLAYLDNNLSRYPKVNENYARELMELHTVGVNGGYTQTDVSEVARCFSGWTIQGRGDFYFDPAGHDFGSKTFLGQTIPAAPGTGAAGVSDGETVLNFLVTHPSTASFISTKMIRWLLQYEPPPALVARVAAVYTQSGGDIPAMIRAILTPDNVINAPVKHKRPFHFVASALRSLNPVVTKLTAIATTQLGILGQDSFIWETPDGYPDSVNYWAGGVMSRWRFADFLTALTSGDVIVDVAPFMVSGTADGITAAINSALFAGEMPASDADRIRSYLAAAAITSTRTREAVSLAIGSAGFQWY